MASEQAAKEAYDQAVATARGDFEETAANAAQTKAGAQADALRAYEQAKSEAALDKAAGQAGADGTVAGAGASSEKPPKGDTPPTYGPPAPLYPDCPEPPRPDDYDSAIDFYTAYYQWEDTLFRTPNLHPAIRDYLWSRGQSEILPAAWEHFREERERRQELQKELAELEAFLQFVAIQEEIEQQQILFEYEQTHQIRPKYLSAHEAHSAFLVDVWTEHGTSMVWAIPGGFGKNFLTLAGGAVGVKYNGQVARPPRAVLTHSQGQGRITDAGRELRALTLKGWRRGKGAIHQDRHGQYMGYQSLREYTEAAKQFQRMSGNVIEAKVGNMLFKYDHATQRVFDCQCKGAHNCHLL